MNAQKNVLICEDDPVQLRILTALMEQAGYRSLAARSPAEALTAARRCGVDAVLTDVQLLDGSGFDLMADLRKIGMDAPVIMATAYATEGMKARALRAGVQRFLEKPLDLRMIRQHVDRVVRHARRAESHALVVESRDAVRAEIEEAARRAGLGVLAAKDGAKALEVLRASQPGIDLMLMDLNAPGPSGAALVREALRARPGLHVVMMTGEASRDEIRAGYEAGAASLVRRPIAEERLVKFLKQSLSAARERRSEADRRRERDARRAARPWTRKLARGFRRSRHLGAGVIAAASLLLGMVLAWSLAQGYEAADRYEKMAEDAITRAGQALAGPKEDRAFTRRHPMEQLQVNRQANEAARRYYEGNLQELKGRGLSRDLSAPAEPLDSRLPDRTPRLK